MKHARKDYNCIQDPSGNIAEDEPVFLLRAKDQIAPSALRFWADEVERLGDKKLADHVRAHAGKMNEWQAKNGWQVPDTPADQMS